VNLSTLDKVFNAITLEPPVLLKLDVQGYESTTLRGATIVLRERNTYVKEINR